MSLTLISAPAVEPVSLQQFKAHARLARDDEDAMLNSYITAARVYCETYLRRQLITATWRLSLSYFPSIIRVPLPPLQSVSSITYVDTNGTTQTLAADQYTVDGVTVPGQIVPAYNVAWPDARLVPNAVLVTFVAGYGATAATVPETIRQAVRMLASHWYENREPVVVGTITANLPFAVEALLASEKIGAYEA